jgi:hypothetical protein
MPQDGAPQQSTRPPPDEGIEERLVATSTPKAATSAHTGASVLAASWLWKARQELSV